MGKPNTPLPQPLPLECQKAAKILRSFVDTNNNGLDRVVPRQVLQNAKGFAIFTVVKAGFVFSGRCGSGVVIARLDDGSFSAPSAIGTGGFGFGPQAGAEVTDFLIVLNSRSAVRSFMSAGSLTLGGNLSLALGPLGRNGEASASLNTKGKVAAMFSYSKTKGLFGGVSLEGSVVVERQDANRIAYGDSTSVKQLLSGAVPVPYWAEALISALKQYTSGGIVDGWVDDPDYQRGPSSEYAFSGIVSRESAGVPERKRSLRNPFGLIRGMTTGSSTSSGSGSATHHALDDGDQRFGQTRPPSYVSTSRFETQFDSDFNPERRAPSSRRANSYSVPDPLPNFSTPLNAFRFNSSPVMPLASHSTGTRRPSGEARQSWYESSSAATHSRTFSSGNLSNSSTSPPHSPEPLMSFSSKPVRQLSVKKGLNEPVPQGTTRAIALYDYLAREAGDLSFHKGDVIYVVEKTDKVDDWWKGRLAGEYSIEGVFPANFVSLD